MEPILIVLGIILVIVIGGGLWLYAGRRRGQVPDEISAHKPISVEDLLPSEGEDAEGEAEGEADTEPAATLESPESIPGRMQRISQRDGRRGLCIVDFAHTPDAMELALKAVRPITPGRLIVVFGSDGDRDQGKRPMLGEVCARLADVLVVTDENPRSEDPQLIRNAILEGVRGVRPDLKDVEEITTWRGDAVRRGVELCGPDDTVIVTGKGHEPFLEMAGEFIRYNDAPVMAEAVEEKWGRA